MAASNNTFNRTIIIGRLGFDHELKQGKNTSYARFSLSNNSITKDGQSEVQWHKICAFGKQAALCQKYLHKGDLCCIEGRLDSRTYEKNGQKQYSSSIIAERITFLNSKRKTDAESGQTEADVLDVVFP